MCLDIHAKFHGDRPPWGRDLKGSTPPPPPSKHLLSKSPVKIGLSQSFFFSPNGCDLGRVHYSLQDIQIKLSVDVQRYGQLVSKFITNSSQLLLNFVYPTCTVGAESLHTPVIKVHVK